VSTILACSQWYQVVALDRSERQPDWETQPVLLLSRKSGQSIVINDDIVITIVAVDRNRVQIGIKAPGYVPIFRQEIVERMIEAGEIEPLACLQAEEPARA
jgi:carbon storage regulator